MDISGWWLCCCRKNKLKIENRVLAENEKSKEVLQALANVAMRAVGEGFVWKTRMLACTAWCTGNTPHLDLLAGAHGKQKILIPLQCFTMNYLALSLPSSAQMIPPALKCHEAECVLLPTGWSKLQKELFHFFTKKAFRKQMENK